MEIIRTHYGPGAWISRVQALLPGRTKGAIGLQAHKMGIKKSVSWRPDENLILQKFYHEMGSSVAEKLPGRTIAAIKTQVRRLGLTQRSNRSQTEWTPEEIKLLEVNQSMSVKKIMILFPGKTRYMIENMRKKIKEGSTPQPPKSPG